MTELMLIFLIGLAAYLVIGSLTDPFSFWIGFISSILFTSLLGVLVFVKSKAKNKKE